MQTSRQFRGRADVTSWAPVLGAVAAWLRWDMSVFGLAPFTL